MITSPEYLAARAYNVAAHPLQTLDRINVNGADVLNGVMGIADKIRNKEYGALARGGGYAAGSVAQVYLLGKGIEKCGDWADKKIYELNSNGEKEFLSSFKINFQMNQCRITEGY